KEIIKEYRTDPDKISIIYPGVDRNFFQPQSDASIERVKIKYQIQKPYILSVATIEPRKNLVGLLRAFDQLDESIKHQYSLVLTGGKGWLDEEINSLYEKLIDKYSILKTGYV